MSTTMTEGTLARVEFLSVCRLAAMCRPKTFETAAMNPREGALGLYLISKGRTGVFKTENGLGELVTCQVSPSPATGSEAARKTEQTMLIAESLGGL